jgi:regulator of replication initiation timing
MRQYNGTEQKKVCACDMEECQKIGYSHSGMLCFPTDATDVEVAIRALGIQCPTTKANIVRDPRSHRIAPWHYHRNHLQKNANGNWSIRTMQKYTDSDRKVFNFAPPNGNIKQFIESDILPMGHSVCRGGVDVPPSWVKELAALQASNQQQCHASTPNPSNNKMRRVAHPISTPTTTPRPARKRPSPDKAEIEELTAKAALLEVQLNSALNHSYNLEAKVKVLDGENLQLRLENTKLKKENAELRGKVEELEGKKSVISYDDLKPGGMLADYVNSFTFFPTFETNDLFLEIINGDIGVCERIKRYHHVTVEERVKYNNEIRAKMEEEKKNNEAGGNGGGEAGEDLDVIMAEASLEGDADNLDEVMAEANINGTQRTRKRTLHWKTEYLVYCFFTRCNISMTRIAALFGVGRILVHDIVYGWANMLADTLAQFFPVPTRSQMLRAYPKSVIKKFGHAHIFMLLDATEIFAEVASMKSVNAILYSAYKHHSTLKWLVGHWNCLE